MAHRHLKIALESSPVDASAPCRIDLGGTLDLRTFHYPMRHLNPSTFNIAIALRTRVRLLPYIDGKVKVTSKGFQSAEYPAGNAPFSHPLGLMFAVADYFDASGIHIDIASASPPRSALGGSSAAAVALTGAFARLLDRENIVSRRHTAMLAHAIEETVAGVPCGMQDQLAAAYGGVNEWRWPGDIEGPAFIRHEIAQRLDHRDLEQRILIAYCGIPHESKNINSRWVKDFLLGKYRSEWADIISITKNFIDSLSSGHYKDAALAMNMETGIRAQMTPDVLDDIGKRLVELATEHTCGARFTGAGGGGCIWALGESDDIGRLKSDWQKILSERTEACLLKNRIDVDGLIVSFDRSHRHK